MPTLYFTDGSSKPVEYIATVNIRKVQNGELIDGQEPTPEQKAYAAKVVDIDYNDLPSLKHPQREQLVVREHDTGMDKIYKSGLKGRDLFHAVCHRIRQRNQQKI